MGDAVGERDRRAGLGRDLDLVESRPPSLFLLPPFGDQRRVRRHRVEERDRDVERHGRLAVGVARRAEGAGGGRPRPRNGGTASAMIAVGTATVACTRIALTMLGRTWRAISLTSPAPSARAPCT